MKQLTIICLFAAMLAACGPSTNITNSWSASDMDAARINKVMIVGMTKDQSFNQSLEQQLSQNLTKEGYATSGAYAQFGPGGFKGDNERQAMRRLKSSGVDGVLSVALLDKEQEQNYIPNNTMYYPVGPRFGRFWGYYNYYSYRVNDPGYYKTSTKYFLEANLYNAKTNKLVYSAQSETFDPSSRESFAADYARAIVANMKSKSLIKSVASR